ncbi:LysR substrate-binding domain-containing protein [Pelagibius sp. 7325]|uniref:LysR substrate-binding domain-containing protein n=1 Tax=Pelagibius sp. 7325 TaxID=3131994 RepID=UPI0030ECF84C
MRRNLPGARALRTFEAAGRHLNFTRAAREVGLTPAAVSFQIKEIEDQLDLKLFTRSSRSIQFTPAGAVLFEAAAEALDSLQRAVGRARSVARGTNQLHLSLSARFAANWLLPRLSLLRQACPAFELTFDVTDQLRSFDLDDIDLAVRFGAGQTEGARSHRLFDTRVVAICSKRLLETGVRFEQPRDLFGETLCYMDWKTGDLIWPNWRMWMAEAGIDDFDDSRCIAFSDSGHVVQAVLDGAAIGLADLPMIADDIARGRLVRLFDFSLAVGEDYTYQLVYPEGTRHDPRIVAFREWILAEAERTMLQISGS